MPDRYGGTVRADRAEIISTDPALHAVHARVDTAAGTGSAVHAISTSTASGVPAVLVEGAGDLLNCKTLAGTSRLKLDNAGNLTVPGSVIGTKAITSLYTQPAGTVAASMDRFLASATSAATVSGTVYVVAIPIDAGVTVTNVNFFSVGAESGSGNHAWVGLADSSANHVVLAISADNTAAAYFAANTATVTALGTPYVTTTSGLYYAFVMVSNTAGANPTFAAAPAMAHVNLPTVPPIVCGTTLASQTTPVAVASNLSTITPTAGHNFYVWLT